MTRGDAGEASSDALRSGVPRPLASPRLVGRDDERARVLAALTSPPAVVLVEGEPGVGKTRLVDDLLRQPEAAERPQLVGRCEPMRTPFPLGAVLEAVRGLRGCLDASALDPVAGSLRPLLPELAEELPPSTAPLQDPLAERHRVFRGLVEILAAVPRPILVLEDLHWADETTGDFVAYLVQHLPDGLAVVTTCRRDNPQMPSVAASLTARLRPGVSREDVALEPLEAGEVRALVGAILSTDKVSREFGDYIWQSTGGLPFAVEEVLRLLQDRKDLVRGSGHWERRTLDELGVPTAVRDSVLERVAHLSDAAQAIVRAVAVVGATGDVDLIAAVAECEPAVASTGLAEAMDAGIVRDEDATYAFRHALASQAVYESIPGPLRRTMHRTAGEVLEKADDPAMLGRVAEHFKHAKRLTPWVRHAEAAADRALELNDDYGAYRFLREVVEVPGLPVRDRARLASKLATAALHSLNHVTALPVLKRLVDDDDVAPEVRGELRICLAFLLQQAGDASGAREQCLHAARELGEGSPSRLKAVRTLAFAWVVEGDLAEHRAWLEEAEAAAAGADPIERFAAAVDRASMLVDVGDREGWRLVRALPEPTATADMRTLARGHSNLAWSALWLGKTVEAEHHLEAGRELCRSLDYVRLVTTLAATQILLDWSSGRWDGLAEAAAECREEAKIEHVLIDLDFVLASLAAARGDDAAPDRLEDVIGRATRAGSLPVAAAGAAALWSSVDHSPERGKEAVARILSIIENKDVWTRCTDVIPAAVESLCSDGRVAEAVRLVDRMERGIAGCDSPAAFAALATARGIVFDASGDPDRARESFVGAARLWDRMLRPAEGAHARRRAGAILLTAGDAGGRELVLDALAAFEEMDARVEAGRTRRLIRRHGMVPPRSRRSGRRSLGTRLSARERDVLVLAAAGASNRQIASKLFLSHRTVEHYVSSGLRKLGVSSRKAVLGAEEWVLEMAAPPQAHG